MKHRHLSLILIFLLLSLTLMFAQAEQNPVTDDAKYQEMAYNIFDMLYDKDMKVVADIDWNVLIVDYDTLGVKYAKLTTDSERMEFQTKVIGDLSYWLQIYEDEGDYYEWSFSQSEDGTWYLYGITEFFDVYLDFAAKDGKLKLINVSFEDFY